MRVLVRGQGWSEIGKKIWDLGGNDNVYGNDRDFDGGKKLDI